VDYIKAYEDHYRNNGRLGAGGGDGKTKVTRWKKAGFVDGMSILDYGCGCGAILEGIEDKSQYLGVDIVSQAIEYARLDYPECTFKVFTPGTLKTPKKQFIGAGSVFTHTARDLVEQSIKDIKQAMNKDSLGIIDILEGDSNNNTIHLAYWNLQEFAELLLSHGIGSVQIDKVKHPNGFTHTYLAIAYDH